MNNRCRLPAGTYGSYQVEREARWALNSARGRRNGARRAQFDREGVVLHTREYTVVRAYRSKPWGTGTTAHARLSHAVRKVLIAFPRKPWLPGPIGGVTYWCGATSETFSLTNEPTRKVCELCMFQLRRSERNHEGREG